ncbi:MAG: hypothetical protein R3179_05385, partial [Sedimenticolaceae bacterium]|nr:hypothetical protein [Sedimenticolaceae bacterium]
MRNSLPISILLLVLLLTSGQASADARKDYQRGLEAYRDGDLVEAADYMKRSADKGYLKAQVELAGMYLRGEGVDEDAGNAASWYLKAARQGDAAAQYQLAQLYREGKGVREDATRANRW